MFFTQKSTDNPTNSSSTTTTMTFSDKIPITNTSVSNINLFPFQQQQQPSMPTFFETLLSSSSDQKTSSFGFMDLLGSQDYNNTFLSDWLPTTTTTIHHPLPSPASSNIRESSEVLNTPTSPNSTSISSLSNEATVNNTIEHHRSKVELAEEDGDGAKDDDEDKTKKQLKATKKNNPKKQREPGFAFMTKSEVDYLDDGYRWRKYGQKAVKNTPYPRSYYRCTTASCGVKKRVQRSCDDPCIVVTTYEGQHIHPCPATSRPSHGFAHEPNSFGGGGSGSQSYSHFVLPVPTRHKLAFPNAATLVYNNCTTSSITNSPPPWNVVGGYMSSFDDGFVHNHGNYRGFGSSGFVPESLLRDNGLLRDIIQMKKEENDDDSIKGGNY